MTPAISAIVQSFRLRTMSYRHYKSARDAMRRATEARGLDEMRGTRRAFDVACHYHEALAVPLERDDIYARPGRGAR